MGSLGDTLSVAIGMVLIYLLLSVIASYIQEWIATLLNMRAGMLADAVQLLLQPASEKLNGLEQVKKGLEAGKKIWDKGIVEGTGQAFNAYVGEKIDENALVAFYAHPVIRTLSQPGKLPSYISAHDFSITLMDMFLQAGTPSVTKPEEYLANIKAGLDALKNEDLRRSVLPYIQAAENTEVEIEKKVAAVRSGVESWFNSTMDRASGWYRRRLQWMAILLGILIALTFNADSIGIIQNLWRDAALRQTISTAAEVYIQKDNPQKADAALAQLGAINLPIGWSGKLADRDPATPNNPQDFPSLPNEIFFKVLGLLITGLAISHGSALWFDLLSKLVNLRGSGSKPPDSAQETNKASRR